MLQVSSNTVQREMAAIRCRKKTVSSMEQGPVEATSDFSWEKFLRQMKDQCKWTTTLMDAILPPAWVISRHFRSGFGKGKKNISIQEADHIRTSRLGLQLAVALYTLNPYRYKSWHIAFGMDMWKHGVGEATFHILNRLGVTSSKATARRNVDKLIAKSDSKVKAWKQEIEEVHNDLDILTHREMQLIQDVDQRTDDSREDDHVLAEQGIPAFSLTFDNVQWKGLCHRQGKGDRNQFFLRCLAFATKNRTPSTQLKDKKTVKATELPVNSFIPAQEDHSMLHDRFVICVERILVAQLKYCHDVQVEKHVHHEQTDAMNKKSTLISLGAINANPSSNEGILQIMDVLHNYVPSLPDGPFPILMNGDGLSVDLMRSAKAKRCRAPTAAGRYDGLVVSPQEFHHEALHLQDTMKKYFSEDTVNIPGTLYNIKEYAGHRGVKMKVLENFADVWHLVELTSSFFVILLAMELMGVTDIQEIPEDFPSSKKEQQDWVREKARQVVDEIWVPVSPEDIHLIEDGFCGVHSSERAVAKGDAIIRCCNEKCEQESCSVMRTDATQQDLSGDSDWYCSDTCRQAPGYIYCGCKSHNTEDDLMIECERSGQCKRDQWYHPSCIRASGATIPGSSEVWFCSSACEKAENLQKDKILLHNYQLLYQCLWHLSFRDIVREGDGQALVGMWRFGMLKFWNDGHTHYRKIAHQFLANVAGVADARTRHELIWERLANPSGQEGANVGLDLCNEFLNNQFKDTIKNCHGRYTDLEIERRSKMCGGFGKVLDQSVEAMLTSDSLDEDAKGRYNHRANTEKLHKEVLDLVNGYEPEKLFRFCPERSFSAPPNVCVEVGVKRPRELGRYLRTQSKSMDKWEKLRHETRERIRAQTSLD